MPKMDKPKFEIHLTFDGEHATAVEAYKHFIAPEWKFSRIDGDPILGSGARAYLTTYSFTKEGALASIAAAKANMEPYDIVLTREKIECIVHDVIYSPPAGQLGPSQASQATAP